MNQKINHLAVIVCVILLHAIGFLWYGPLFGEKWMAMVNLDMAQIEANAPGAGIWVANFIASIAPVYMLAWLLARLNVTSGVTGAILGFLITFTFHHLPTMSGNMFAQQPYGLAWITGGYSMIAMAISGFILGAWVKR